MDNRVKMHPNFKLLMTMIYVWSNIGSIGVGHNVKPSCGGTFTAARGILNTPNFPSSFPTPINCEWVIDRQLFDASNDSIVVYLTQLFLAEGLTFTEYQVYEPQFQFAGREVHKVEETNVAKVRYIQTYQNYLVINLNLDSPHGVHLRVLDHFLDMYGFNITYEITGSGPRRDACSMMDCGFTGTCYDHYSSFQCVCLPGYEGPHCSQGPSSYCHNSSPCRNGGTCMQIGAAAIKCVCPTNFTGDTCEILKTEIHLTDCVDCLQGCQYDSRGKTTCQCSPVNKIQESLLNDGIGLSLSMQLSNVPKMRNDQLKSFILRQTADSLNMNHTRVKIMNLTKFAKSQQTEVTIRLIVDHKEEKRTRLTLTKWAERGHIGNLTLNSGSPFSVTTKALLYLVSISANVQEEVREGAEFILTCVARGSPDLKFYWLKDNKPINVSRDVRNKWSRIIRDPHVSDQYTALLGISFIHQLDNGIFTCQVNDGKEQQCRSYHVRVLSAPNPRIEPVSLTAHKGDNFTIKCLCPGQLTYSWTKNHLLLPVRTNTERYEILYPGGSLLQVFGIDRDTIYSCLVQGRSGSAERSILVSVVDNRVRTCPNEKIDGVLWPETAPDTTCFQECPRGYYGIDHASRPCVLSPVQGPTWMSPDFSGCIKSTLQEYYLEFQKLYLGYSSIEATNVLSEFLKYIENSEEGVLLPGEGAGIMKLTTEITAHIKKSNQESVIKQSMIMFLQILDELLSNRRSFMASQQVESVQENMKNILLIDGRLLNNSQNNFHKTFKNFDVHQMILTHGIKLNGLEHSNDLHYSLEIEPIQWKKPSEVVFSFNATLIVVFFKNITVFLPKRSTLHQGDIESEYEILNGTLAAWLEPHQPLEISVQFHHEVIDINKIGSGWRLKCASANLATSGDVWKTDLCDTQLMKETYTKCVCTGPGVVSLLLVTDPDSPSSKPVRQLPFPVIVGCILCVLLCLVSTVYLTYLMITHASCLIFLKLQCSICSVVCNSLFTVAVIIEPLKDMFMAFTSAIACSFLLGLSSHLSTLLVVWTEVIPFKGIVSRPSVAAIATGLPILAVFGNILAHGTMDLEPLSWWLQYNTLAFGIITLSAVLICCLFTPLHIVLIKKIQKVQQLREKNVRLNEKRTGLLQRSASLFVIQMITASSSVVFINHLDQKWPQYLFCCCTISHGVLLLVCYCAFPETKPKKVTKDKHKSPENQFFGADTNSPLNFFPKAENTSEREVLPQPDFIHTQMMPTFKTDCTHADETKMTTSFCEPIGFKPNILEAYTYPKAMPSKTPPLERLSPDILGDLGEATPVDRERSQPDGRERDKLDGVLDSITHDLEYLLNQGESDSGSPSYIPPPPKPPAKSFPSRNMELIQEESEEDLKLPDSITDILRTNC